MVLSEILGLKEARKKPLYIFFAAILYSIIGIACAVALFPDNVGLITIAFISVLLLPILNNLLRYKSTTILRHINLKAIIFEQRDIFTIYTCFFLGIFLIFLVVTTVLPIGMDMNLFSAQLQFYGQPTKIIGDWMPFFVEISQHNIKIVLLTFVLSLMYGAGSVIILTWNASVWGSVLGFVLKQGFETSNPWAFIVANIGIIMPFLLLESIAYVSAAIAGGVLSKTVIQEKLFSKRFKFLLTNSLLIVTIAIVLVFIGAWIEALLI
jgi:hypothetical protein